MSILPLTWGDPVPLSDAERTVLDEIRAAMERTDPGEIEALEQAIMDARRVFVAGAGRSLLMMRAFAMRLMHIGLSSYVVGETVTPSIEAGDLLIVGSGSGQTRTTLAMVEAARDRGATTAALTAHPLAPIARHADVVVTIRTPITDRDPAFRSLQPPGSLFEQCLLLACEAIILRLMRRLGTTEEQIRARHTKLE